MFFLRVEGFKPALSAAYEGPFKVVSRSAKVITITKQNRDVTISLDRVKPAYLLNESSILDNKEVSKKVRFAIDFLGG